MKRKLELVNFFPAYFLFMYHKPSILKWTIWLYYMCLVVSTYPTLCEHCHYLFLQHPSPQIQPCTHQAATQPFLPLQDLEVTNLHSDCMLNPILIIFIMKLLMCDFLYLTSPTYAVILACLCGVLFVVSVSVESLPLSLSARLYTIENSDCHGNHN